ncbi:hypothetical protein B0H17DRAFT_1115663 [Mycena rosella]|uniref:Uncharacterized protein n=1 Tax=Mycena rosella TaxID=1033263 RepID=A0AAD7BBG8_MYCRO|nr:hypothetical protein B0H17DRAFT_1115663 [Mycena rosella]
MTQPRIRNLPRRRAEIWRKAFHVLASMIIQGSNNIEYNEGIGQNEPLEYSGAAATPPLSDEHSHRDMSKFE